jgi:hypothetical protein
MLTADDDHVAGFEDLTFPMTQVMEETHGDLPVEVEELDVQVQPTPSVQRWGIGARGRDTRRRRIGARGRKDAWNLGVPRKKRHHGPKFGFAKSIMGNYWR